MLRGYPDDGKRLANIISWPADEISKILLGKISLAFFFKCPRCTWNIEFDKEDIFNQEIVFLVHKKANGLEIKLIPGSCAMIALKCNTNAAVFQKANMTTWVAMLRDSIGSFVGCCFGFGDGCMKANMVEALAVREAPSWLKDKIIAAIIMETNCPTVIEACTNPAEDSEMGIGS
ncbi:hypothetical protein Gohar_025497 [Gossypium harknessii]|uniref:RNase H type-1 domain-containing protein n=1 Tax=Gossypium harknessii TaxID=34285 RepID=A0A7J9I6G9_9ROSI|nr:hypothetical protein [Gossypium harknessii]